MTSSPASSSKHRPGGKLYGASALVALAILFIGVTILIMFSLRAMRLDLTESRMYSLAPGTQRIVASLDEPINLYFFFSQDASAQAASLRTYAQHVREMLEEMAQRSGGKLRLHIIDPKPFSEEEDRAAQFGLSAVPLGRGGESLYFGLAGTNSTDGRETIAFFLPDKEEFLEYDIASLIYRLEHPKRPIVGLLSELPVDASFDPMSGRMREGWASIAQLREQFEVRSVAGTIEHIDDDIDVLMIIHPKNLTPQSLYAIDQFVMRGGKLAVFVDPQSENDTQDAGMGPMDGASRSSTLSPLFEAWGVQYDPTLVLGDRELGLTVALRQGEAPSQHIAIIGFDRAAMNPEDVVTASLDSINAMTAGFLAKKQGAAIELQPLIQSSMNAAPLAVARLAFLQDNRSLLDDFKPTGERYIVAARLHGKLKSAFPQGRPAADDHTASAAPAESGAAHRLQSEHAVDLIIVADTDILSDSLWVRTQNVFGQRLAMAWANNGDFLANALDNLAGSSDLISIRGRQSFFRPFTKVEVLRRRADDRLRAKETELDRELQDTERKLAELEAGKDRQSALRFTPEQEMELERFQHERIRIRKELREVRRNLDVEIERLGTFLKILNIALIPVLLAIGAIALTITRRRRLRAVREAVRTG